MTLFQLSQLIADSKFCTTAKLSSFMSIFGALTNGPICVAGAEKVVVENSKAPFVIQDVMRQILKFPSSNVFRNIFILVCPGTNP